MQWRRLQAKLFLAGVFFWQLAWRILSLGFLRKRNRIEEFLENYALDGILPVESAERSLMPLSQACQNCSLCTLSCSALRQGTAPSGFEPKYILLALGRSSHESEIFMETWVPCVECSECTVLSPVGVPVHGVASLIVARRNRVGFRRAG